MDPKNRVWSRDGDRATGRWNRHADADEHAAVESYLYGKLIAAGKDLAGKMAIILDLEKQCASRLEGVNYLKEMVAERDAKIAKYKNPIGYWLGGMVGD